jgi:hypothetical protein
MKSSSAEPRQLFRHFLMNNNNVRNQQAPYLWIASSMRIIPHSNPLGTTEEEAREAYRVIYSAWRTNDSPSTVEDLQDKIITDFIAPIRAIGIMAADEGTKTGRLKATHGYERFPGLPGKSHPDRRANFAFEGDVDGTDAYTFAADKNQWGLTPYVNVPKLMERHLTLMEASPSNNMVGPYVTDEAGVHAIHTRSAICGCVVGPGFYCTRSVPRILPPPRRRRYVGHMSSLSGVPVNCINPANRRESSPSHLAGQIGHGGLSRPFCSAQSALHICDVSVTSGLAPGSRPPTGLLRIQSL